MSKTIEETREARIELQDKIRALVSAFEERFDVECEVGLERVRYQNWSAPRSRGALVSVNVEVRV